MFHLSSPIFYLNMIESNIIEYSFDFVNNEFYKPRNNEKSLSFIYANIRSMRSNFNQFIIEINQLKEKIHFIILVEIWIGKDEVSLYNIPGYTSFSCCNEDYRAGGVICYVSNELSVRPLDVNMMTADILVLDVRDKNVYFKLCCVYRLLSFQESQYIDELESVLQVLENNAIYIGDANLNLLQQNTHSQNYCNLLDNYGFVSVINTPTRITKNTKTCIDHIFIKNKNISSFKSAKFDIGITDHCLLGLVYNESKNNSIDSNNMSHTKVVHDYNLIKSSLKLVQWNDVMSDCDVNKCYEVFQNKIIDVVEKSSKQLNLQNKLCKAKIKSPWISGNLLNRINRRKKLYKICKRRPYDINFNVYYKKFCTNLRQEIDFAKNEYYRNLINRCNGDSSQQWKVINQLTGSSKAKTVDKITLDNDVIVSEPPVVADMINKHLIETQSITGCAFQQNIPLHTHPRQFSFFVHPTNELEILKIIKSLKNKKSTGHDNLCTDLIKYIAEEISPVLSYIINLSFSTGCFPEKLKQSVVVPIYKKQNSFHINTIRPISLLCVFSKIIEKLMNIRLLKYLNNFSFFSKNQFGFTKGKSTDDALLNVCNQIYSSINDNKKTTGLFIDFKNAFDLVNHNILLMKLEAVGVRGVALDWFTSFLSNRRQSVRVGGCLSSSLQVRAGVPQGSVLSATCFLVFINDLLETPFNGSVNAFADDVAFFYSHGNVHVIKQQIDEDITFLRNWCSRNQMIINVTKTKYVNFDFKGFNFETPLIYHDIQCPMGMCDCKIIEKVDHFKYLGLVFDEKMSWEKHNFNYTKKLNLILGNFIY